jgi:short-subunit dehydrogenase
MTGPTNNMATILFTGASSGIDKARAKLSATNG